MKTIRVLVVDDSAMMRRFITDFLQSDNEIQVVATARNGKEAIDVLAKVQVDVVTLDIEMPVMDGMQSLSEITRIYQLPVIVLCSQSASGTDAVKAKELGAFDFVAKPSGSISLDLVKVSEELIKKVKVAAIRKKNSEVTSGVPLPPGSSPVYTPGSRLVKHVVAIGTSTGGPRALQMVLTGLPADLDAAVVVVQHMPAGFTKSLANRLDQMCAVHVHEAEQGQELEPGHVYIAPGDFHMEVENFQRTFRIQLNQSPPVGGHRPAVNILFDSVARLQGVSFLAVILTGMGNDGVEGLKKIKLAGGKTISEAKETSVVYGMPKAAYETGCVDAIVPLQEVSNQILRFLSTWKV